MIEITIVPLYAIVFNCRLVHSKYQRERLKASPFLCPHNLEVSVILDNVCTHLGHLLDYNCLLVVAMSIFGVGADK